MRVFLFFMVMGGTCFSQVRIHFSWPYNILLRHSVHYSKIKHRLGKADSVQKETIDQPFCGVTRGQNISFFYKKQGIKLNCRKRLGYVLAKDIGTGENYYNNCWLNSACISSNSTMKLNGVRVGEYDLQKIKRVLGKPRYESSFAYAWAGFAADISEEEKKEVMNETLTGLTYRDKRSDECLNFYFHSNGKLAFIIVSGPCYGKEE